MYGRLSGVIAKSPSQADGVAMSERAGSRASKCARSSSAAGASSGSGAPGSSSSRPRGIVPATRGRDARPSSKNVLASSGSYLLNHALSKAKWENVAELNYEKPLGNNAAKGRLASREAERRTRAISLRRALPAVGLGETHHSPEEPPVGPHAEDRRRGYGLGETNARTDQGMAGKTGEQQRRDHQLISIDGIRKATAFILSICLRISK